LTNATAQGNKTLTPNLDTLQVKKAVILDSVQAKSAIADLIAGDACKDEMKVTRFVLKLTEKKSELQDGVIKNLESQKRVFIQKDLVKDEQLASKDIIIKATEKQLNRKEAVSWVWKGVAFVGALSTTYLLITR